MAKIKSWTKVWDGKKTIRYQHDLDRESTLEIFSAKVDPSTLYSKRRWFVSFITKDKIYQFPQTKNGVTKLQAQKIAVNWMMNNPKWKLEFAGAN
jgi:hypothetical protein